MTTIKWSILIATTTPNWVCLLTHPPCAPFSCLDLSSSPSPLPPPSPTLSQPYTSIYIQQAIYRHATGKPAGKKTGNFWGEIWTGIMLVHFLEWLAVSSKQMVLWKWKNLHRAVSIYTRLCDLGLICKEIGWGSPVAAFAGGGQVEREGSAPAGGTCWAEGGLARRAGPSAGRKGWGAAASCGQCAVWVPGWLPTLHGREQGHLGLRLGLRQEAPSSGAGQFSLELGSWHDHVQFTGRENTRTHWFTSLFSCVDSAHVVNVSFVVQYMSFHCEVSST